jgi:hypothetical protein
MSEHPEIRAQIEVMKTEFKERKDNKDKDTFDLSDYDYIELSLQTQFKKHVL